MRLGAIILAVCLGLGVIEAIQVRFGSGDMAEVEWWIAFWRTVPSWLLLAGLSPLVVWTSDRWPIRGESWSGALLRHLVISAPFAFAHLSLAAVWAGFRPGSLEIGFAAGLGWLTTRYLVYGILSYGALVGVVHAYRYHREMEARQKETTALLDEVEVARVRALEGKLHPHFVFNTLNAISGLAARGDQSGVVATLDAFSALLLATLDDQDAKLVPLRDEADLLDSYLAIQRVRFGDRLNFQINLGEGTRNILVPGLLLQPLVENALSHGAGRNRDGGTVVVTARCRDSGLEVRVSDSGPGSAQPKAGAPMSFASSGKGIGIDGTRARLTALFGDLATLELSSDPNGGTTATVFVPGRSSKGEAEPR